MNQKTVASKRVDLDRARLLEEASYCESCGGAIFPVSPTHSTFCNCGHINRPLVRKPEVSELRAEMARLNRLQRKYS